VDRRVKDDEIASIKQTAREAFGDDVKVYLFGS
jgi:predicted nucleotidyltransferase